MKKNLLGKVLALSVSILGVLFFIYSLVSSYIEIDENKITTIEITGWLMLSLLIAPLIAYLTTKYLSKKVYIILLVGIAFLLRIGWAYWIKTPIISDFHVLYSAAIDIANGDYGFMESSYFQKWTYQVGFSFYESIVILIFGESPRALKFLNILYSVGTVVVVYLTATKLFNELSGRIAGLIFALYIPSILMSSVLTNQHLSTFFYFLALYLVINSGFSKKYRWITIGLLIGLGNIIRPLGSIVLLAILVYVVIVFLLKGNKEIYLTYAKKLIGIIAVYLAVQKLVSMMMMGIGITDETLKNKDSLYKFVVGFNHETEGKYSNEDREYLDQFSLWDERNEKAKELIQERISDKGEVLELWNHKFTYLWGDKDSSIHWSLNDLSPPQELVDSLYKIERVMYMLTLTFCIIGFSYILFWGHKLNSGYPLILIFLLGYAAAHILIEVQTRYRFDIMPAMMILQGYGIYLVTTKIGTLFRHKKNKKTVVQEESGIHRLS